MHLQLLGAKSRRESGFRMVHINLNEREEACSKQMIYEEEEEEDVIYCVADNEQSSRQLDSQTCLNQ